MGTRGGILLGWNSDFIEASNVQCKIYSLTVEIKTRVQNSNFQLTLVYGPTDDNEKENFLVELSSLKPPGPTPWIVQETLIYL
jgi:hypothetical protein